MRTVAAATCVATSGATTMVDFARVFVLAGDFVAVVFFVVFFATTFVADLAAVGVAAFAVTFFATFAATFVATFAATFFVTFAVAFFAGASFLAGAAFLTFCEETGFVVGMRSILRRPAMISTTSKVTSDPSCMTSRAERGGGFPRSRSGT